MDYTTKKEMLAKSGRSTRYFDLSLPVQEMLKHEADVRRIPQVTMLEHIIRNFCKPETVRKNDVF